MTPAVWLRRFVWVVCALLLASLAEASSSRTVTADFDGDGRSDSVSIDRVDPSILHITLSRTGTATRIRRARAVLEIAAHDVDGDHLPELITAEASAAPALTHARALRVWKTDAHHGLKKVHPRRRATPRTLKAPIRRTLEKDEPADDSSDDLGGITSTGESLNTRDPVAPDASSADIVPSPHPDAALASVLPRDLSTPRAPPAQRG
jgi:hypothetical protein